MEHSKLPWVVENVDNMRSNRRPESLEINNDEWNITGWTEAEICGGVYEQDLANANFIVKACNHHKDLLDLARNIARGVDVDIESVKGLLKEIDE
jgi:hypothetical protein